MPTLSVSSLPRRGLPTQVQVHLGDELRRLYDAIGAQPLPIRLVRLVKRLERTGISVAPALRSEILAVLPNLRHYAISLSGSLDRADDLVQETVLKAWTYIDRFEPGTNLQAWLFTILRNQFYSEHRKRQREVEDTDGEYAAQLISMPEQPGKIALSELQEALDELGPEQREAVVLIGVEGLSYEDVARICGVAVGTVKSRVNRARTRLAEFLAISNADEFGPDRLIRAACSVQKGPNIEAQGGR